VKLRVTEYGLLLPVASLPLATCCAEVVKGTDTPHAPPLPPVTLLHATLTADVGTVAQPVKDTLAACTLKFHVLVLVPLDVVQLIVAAELPDTAPESGSVAVKLMVPGFAETALIVVPAIGKIFDGTTTLAFFGWAKLWLAAANIISTGVSVDQWFMWR
jgi:hypothetical protein